MVALLTYLATLNRWLTLSNVSLAAEMRGWQWQPLLQQPLAQLMSCPLRWLPAGWTPVGLNVLAAACASLILALLARSVALWLQNRHGQERRTEDAERGPAFSPAGWVPPLLAVAALGFQLTFWQSATGTPADLIELLLFAAVIWCLLEHRHDRRMGWLDLASFLCGLALANSWAIAGFLPLAAAGLIWSKRLRFFNMNFLRRLETYGWERGKPALAEDGRFFLRMFLLGLAGLSTVLLLAVVKGFGPDSRLKFGQVLWLLLTSYKSVLVLMARVFRAHREATLLLVVVTMAPILVMSIRWRALENVEHHRRLDLVAVILYATHAFLLLLGVSVAFDPPWSPRGLSPRFGINLSFLPLYYLCALSIGYYSGFLLLAFSHSKSRGGAARALKWAVPISVYLLLGVTLLGLLGKNLPTIRLSNGPQLERYARLLAQSLPPSPALLYTQEPARLTLLRAASSDSAERYVGLDANAFPLEEYRAWLRKEHPKLWTASTLAVGPAFATNGPLNAVGVVYVLDWIARSNRLCCLEPNYSYLVERFHFQPRGLIYELKDYATNSFDAPPLTSAELAKAQEFWEHLTTSEIEPLAAQVREAEQPQPGLVTGILRRAHISRPLPETLRVLAHWYSSALDCRGVALQREGRLAAATPFFTRALELNPDNIAARVNLECNTNRLAGKAVALAPTQSLDEQLEKYGGWARILAAGGPFDNPTYCYRMGLVCAQQRMVRQAGQLFERAATLAPKEVSPQLALATLYNACGLPDWALRAVTAMRSDPAMQPLAPRASVQLAFVEANAWYAKTNRAKAEEVLQSALDANPEDTSLLEQTEVAFAAMASYTNALRLAEQRLQRAPTNIPALMNKGILCLMAGEPSNAVPVFTHLLALTNSCPVRLYRAVAYIRLHQWDSAEADYNESLRLFPDSCQAYVGLGEVALLRGNTNLAIQHFRQFLAKAPTNSQSRAISARLQALQSAVSPASGARARPNSRTK